MLRVLETIFHGLLFNNRSCIIIFIFILINTILIGDYFIGSKNNDPFGFSLSIRQMELRLDSSIHQQILHYLVVLAVKEAKAVVAVVRTLQKSADQLKLKPFLKLIKGTFSRNKKKYWKLKEKINREFHEEIQIFRII